MIGKTILHYRILEEIGRGGMGVVYKAEDTKLGRVVALKFLPEHVTGTEEERARFLQEARAASALNHPNVCTIHGIEEYEGRDFIEMELVEGVTLRERIAKAPLSFNDAMSLALQIGEALNEAHSRGIVHRDIKSENIMVNAKNQIKVMDFGLAKLKGSLKLTKTSSTVGTISYMAPEQIQGAEVDVRSDIFSFGAVVFEVLTRELPFRGEHDAAIMYSILNEDPKSVQSILPEADPDIDRIIRRALEKDPADRYQHVDDMLSELGRLRKQTGRVVRPQQVASQPDQHPSVPIPDHSSGIKWAGVGLAVLLTGAALWYFGTQQTSPLDSIAVLPFVNETADPETDYLAEGLTENIINKLSQLSGLRVIPRSMVARYQGKEVDPGEAGRDLGVRTVLTGKVTQRGDALTIQTELIDIEDVSQLWGEQYNRKLSEIIVVQQDIAQKVAGSLQTRMSGEDEKQLTASQTMNPDAYQAYLKGRFHLNKRTIDGYKKALPYFQEAIQTDPSFALAYVGVADCYFIGVTLDLNPAEYVPRAKQHLELALDLDPELAEAYAGLAAATAYFDFDFASAEKAYRRAIELNPAYSTAHHWLAEFLIYMGRFEEGLTEYRQAIELDPASLPILSDYGLGFFYSRQYDRSIDQLRRTIEMDPNFVRTHFYIFEPYVQKGMDDEAFRELILGMKADGASPARLEELSKVYSTSGLKGVGKHEMERILLQQPGSLTLDLVRYAVLADDREKALALLEQAYELRHLICTTINVDPIWDKYRSEPRFIAILGKMGFEKDRR